MSKEKKVYTSIGGQALMEGILMNGPKRSEMAVRLPDGTIFTEQMEVTGLRQKYAFWKLPLLRGIAAMIDSMRMGFKALSWSAEKSGLDEEEGEPSKFDIWLQKTFGDKIMNAIMVVGTVLGLGLAVVLFFLLPTVLFNLCRDYLFGVGIEGWRSIVEGIMRIAIFVGYILLVSQMKEIRRVFQYHGAEHKTIFCYEAHDPLTVENVRKHGRFHPRCGTSFMILMLLLGILVGFFIPFTNPFLRTGVKLLCIPVIMGLGYELIRLCGRHDNVLTRIIAAPGLWMQRITVKEPDDSMIEVAIAAMNKVTSSAGGEARAEGSIEETTAMPATETTVS